MRWCRGDSSSLSCEVTASEENWGRREGRCKAIDDHAVSGREELDGNDKGRWSRGGEVELDDSLSRGCF
jgi:hypothetical protein